MAKKIYCEGKYLREPERYLQRLIKDLKGLSEREMKMTLLRERLSELRPESVADLLCLLFEGTTPRAASWPVKSLLIMPHSLKDILGRAKYRHALLASLEMGYKKTGRILTDLPPFKAGGPGRGGTRGAGGRFITLGERRTLAKGQVRESLDRLLSDPDPMVVAYLMDNPKIREGDVLKIASRRPASPRVLTLVASHKKWSKRYDVIKAIIQNPYTPPRVSLIFLEILLVQDLRDIVADENLHPQIKMTAKEILDEKG